MKYLLYYLGGRLKKYPLKDELVKIGWNENNDLVLPIETVSGEHALIRVDGQKVILKDRNSTNGTFKDGEKIEKVELETGDSFFLGGYELFLRTGSEEEFRAAEEIIPYFEEIKRENLCPPVNRKTTSVGEIYRSILKEFLHSGLSRNSMSDVVLDLVDLMPALRNFGSLFVLEKREGCVNVLYSLHNDDRVSDLINDMSSEELFEEHYRSMGFDGCELQIYPVRSGRFIGSLLYSPGNRYLHEKSEINSFLMTLSKELVLLAGLVTETEKKKKETNNRSSVTSGGKEIAASSKVVLELIEQCEKVGKSGLFVLVTGENGTGKELFARLIHESSGRRPVGYVALNCAAIPDDLLEAELFGYKKGAFTGAEKDYDGKLAQASGGTLVLDEIGDMPLNLQSKLLRAIQEKEFYPLRAEKSVKVDLRIVSLTNRDLKQMVKESKFRQDLYYRLVHHKMHIPALRERREDIPLLINYFTRKFCTEQQKSIDGFSLETMKILQSYSWPGNVRQLENEVLRLISLADSGELIAPHMISEEITEEEPEPEVLVETVKTRRNIGKEELIEILEKNDWNKSRTAKELNMTYRGLLYKLDRLQITRQE